MRKTLLYIILLGILAWGVYYFLVKRDDKGVYPVEEAGFNIKDTADIGRIFMADKNGNEILLDRTDTGWMVNGTYRVLDGTLNTLLGTLAAQTPLYPVTTAMHNNVIKQMAANSVKVEVYDRSRGKMRKFFVCGETPDRHGSYMLMEGAKEPYVVQIVGLNGYLTSCYSTHLRDWRDRTVFNFPAEEIKKISVQYPENPLNSFVITRAGKDLVVDGDSNIVKHAPLNMRRTDIYLKYFTGISAEGFTNGTGLPDTMIKASRLHCVMDVTTTKGINQHVDIYWMPLNRRSKNMVITMQGVPDDYDGDHFFAVLNNKKDTAVIQEFVFKKFFRKAYEFYEADPPPSKQPQVPVQQPTNVIMHKPS